MALDIAKLENVQKKPDGKIIARCPACAADGNDSKGEHLAVFPDGRFGCAVNPKDKSHTKEIFKLVGIKEAEGDAEDGQIPARPFEVQRCVIPPSTTILILDRFSANRFAGRTTIPTEPLSVAEPAAAPVVRAREACDNEPCAKPEPTRLVVEFVARPIY